MRVVYQVLPELVLGTGVVFKTRIELSMGKGNDPNCSQADHTMDLLEFEQASSFESDPESAGLEAGAESEPVLEENIIRPNKEAQLLLQSLLTNHSEDLDALRETLPEEMLPYFDELRRFADQYPLDTDGDPLEALSEHQLSRHLAQALTLEMRARGQNQDEVHMMLRDWLHSQGRSGVSKETLTQWVNAAGLDWDRLTEGMVPERLSGSAEAAANRVNANADEWMRYKEEQEAAEARAKKIEDTNNQSAQNKQQARQRRTPKKGDHDRKVSREQQKALEQAEQEILQDWAPEIGGLYSVREGRLPDYMQGEDGGFNFQGEDGVFTPQVLHRLLPSKWIEHRIREGTEPTARPAQSLIDSSLREDEAPGGDYLAPEVRDTSRVDLRWHDGEYHILILGVEVKAYKDPYAPLPLVNSSDNFPESLASLDESLQQMDSLLNVRQKPTRKVRDQEVPPGSFQEVRFELLDTKVADSIREMASDPKNWVLREDGKRELVGTVKDGVYAGKEFKVVEDGGKFDLTGAHHLSHVLSNFKAPTAQYLQLEKQQRAEEILARSAPSPALAMA